VYGKANEHDSRKEDVLFESLKAGDIGILDRAYNNFETLYRQSTRGVVFVVREKEAMLHEVVRSAPREGLAKNIIADETIRLAGIKTKESYPDVLRRVTAHVEINGNWHDLVFLTNNFEWAASTVAELYKARWQVELLFKELKQTLQLQDFFGENENAVQWQIWAALLTHLIMRYIKFKSRAVCSYSRFVAFIRAVTWLKKDLMQSLWFYGIAPPPENQVQLENAPYLPGFEKMFARSMG
jgi:IS4 transposase